MSQHFYHSVMYVLTELRVSCTKTARLGQLRTSEHDDMRNDYNAMGRNKGKPTTVQAFKV